MARGRLLLLLAVLIWVAHRVVVALSAGDFLYPLEPSELKHTQIAWDLLTGRFSDRPFAAYVTNSGTVHHGAYSTVAAVYLVISQSLGFGLLSVRAVPILFWAAALLAWGETLRRSFGITAALLAIVGLFFVPTVYLGLQVTMLGSHSEAVLPLAMSLLAWTFWLARSRPTLSAALWGASLGYAVAFSYLLAPLVLLQVGFSTFLGKPVSRRELAAWVVGGLVGAWPLWLIVVLEPGALFAHSVTEDPSSTVGNLAQGGGAAQELLLRTWKNNLPGAFGDLWGEARPAGRWWGEKAFEGRAYKLGMLGPLALLPWAWSDRDPVRRRLLLLAAVGPVATYLFLGWASPWKPHIRERYLIPSFFLGWSAPALAVGVGLLRKGAARWAAMLLGLGALLWILPPRWTEAKEAVAWPRHDALLRARTVAWYNLGIHTVWAEQVDEVNDLLDVRAAQGDPHAWDGIQMGLGGGAPAENLGLARGTWKPLPVGWNELRPGVREWRERRQYQEEGRKDDVERAGANFGWGLGIRTRWKEEKALAVWKEARDSDRWPDEVPWEAVWRGWGFGLARSGQPLPGAWPEELPLEIREAMKTGWEAGTALGEVPKMPMPPGFVSVRGPAT